MVTFSRFIRTTWAQLTLSLLIVGAVMVPIAKPLVSLRWDLVDDGITIASSKLIANAIQLKEFNIAQPLFLEPRFVRFRPVFWIWFWLQHVFFASDPSGYHLTRAMMWFVTAVLVLLSVLFLTRSYRAAVAAAVLYLSQPFDSINWYFLGHHEPLLNLFLLLTLCLVLWYQQPPSQNRYRPWLLAGLVVLMPLLFWSKETSLALVLPVGWLAGYDWLKSDRATKKMWWWLIGVAAGCLAIMFGTLKYLSLQEASGYFSMYKPTANPDLGFYFRLYSTYVLQNCSFLYSLPLLTFGCRLAWQRRVDQLTKWQVAFALGHLSFFLILIPFSLRTENYYLSTSFLFYWLFFGVEIGQLLKHKLPIVRWGLYALIGFLIARNLLFTQSFVTEFAANNQAAGQMMARVVSLTPQFQRVLFNFSENDRGFINGVRIQRVSLFPCPSFVITQEEILYGERSFCPEQELEYIHDKNSTVDVSQYQLLVAGDTRHHNLLMPLDELQAKHQVKLQLLTQISVSSQFADRSKFLEKYLQQTFAQLARNLLFSVRTRQLHLPFQKYPTQRITPTWDFYLIVASESAHLPSR